MTVPVVGGSAPIHGGPSSSTDVLVNSSAVVNMSVGDMVQTNVLVSSDVGFQLANSGTVGSACFDESKARDFESLAGLVLTSNAFPGTSSRESVQGLVRTCLEMCAVDLTEVYSPALFHERSMQRGLSSRSGCRPGNAWQMQQGAAKRKAEKS